LSLQNRLSPPAVELYRLVWIQVGELTD